MGARQIRIREEERRAAFDYLKKAEESYEEMLVAVHAERYNAAAILAVQCVISSADAACVFEKGLRSISQDHYDVCDLIASLPLEDARTKSHLLKRIIAKKNLVQYERRNVHRDESLEMVKTTTRFYQWVKSIVTIA
jgi:HEPN domain-containing protein